ncbi:MAG: hypothetical protein FIB01_11950, partial [Gemmatimonadetes bacterium]|nr:hypothetical protein [Gemmatimonadota bacterium]
LGRGRHRAALGRPDHAFRQRAGGPLGAAAARHGERHCGLCLDAAAHASGVPDCAVVGGLVSGRGAGRRRLRGAAHLLGEERQRDGVPATLCFQAAHYALRPWPWIVTGLATLLLYPDLADRESGYVLAFRDLLPTPWRGFMLAGFAAAYMSTVATQLNWGASYLVNDFYRRFLRKDRSEQHYVAISRGATVLLFLASILVTWQLNSVEQAWRFLLAMGAGTGLVLILRWYWWRINAWSEISAMTTSLVVSSIATATAPAYFRKGDPNTDAAIMLVTVAATTVVWLAVTFLTRPEPQHVLEDFYRRVRPGGPGWARISRAAGFGREPIPGGALAWSNWLAGIVAVYCSLFGIGKLIFGASGMGLALLALAGAAFAWIARSFREAKS